MVLNNLSQESVNQALASIVRDRVEQELRGSRPGHCLRISVLPEPVMRALCEQFNADGHEADIVLLLGPKQRAIAPWEVSATRLIELRNAEARPLLAFIPPGLKAAAEDSFDVSTFAEVNLGDVPSQLRCALRNQLPDDLRPLTDEVIKFMGKAVNDDDVVRYYQTVLENGATKEAAGGAIYQFRLVPHYSLLVDPARVRQELDRNAAAVSLLGDGIQPLLGRILSLKLLPNTLQSDLYTFLRSRVKDGSAEWVRQITVSEQHHHLCFDNWRFTDQDSSDQKLLLIVHDLELPAREPNQPIGPDNPRYLDIKRVKKVKIKWELNVKPIAAPQLSHYRVELVSTSSAVIWESRNISKGTNNSTTKTKSLEVTDFRSLVEDEVEEGIYFFRLRAYSETGERLNEEDPEINPEVLRDPDNPEGKLKNESEDVWFWIDENAPPPVEPQRNQAVSSFLEAKLLAQFSTLDRGEDPFSPSLVPQYDKTSWTTKTSSKRPDATFNIIYDSQTRYTLPVNNLLRRVERLVLSSPENLGRYRLDFRDDTTVHYSVSPQLRPHHDADAVPNSFLQSRKELFNAIRGAGQSDPITATVDLGQFEDLIVAYAQSYRDWLKQVRGLEEPFSLAQLEPVFLDLDVVELLLPGEERVYLVGSTHPLRLLWHLQYARMGTDWLRAALAHGDASTRLTNSVRRFMRQGLVPVNLPPVVRVTNFSNTQAISAFYVEQDPLTPFWGLYIRETVRDRQTLRARVQRALGISYRTVQPTGELDRQLLAQKVQRYLVQHPYLHVLKINVFNPGSAALIVDTILEIEKRRQAKEQPSLRYELRLFTQSEHIDAVGEAVEDLVDPERQVSAEADEFTVPSQNHLFPKLRFSRNHMHEFLQEPGKYEAHISVLRDLFPIDAEPTKMGSGRSSFLHGLIQEQMSVFNGDDESYEWLRQVLPSPTQELAGDNSHTSELIAQILATMSTLQASYAMGRKTENAIPGLRLSLPAKEKSLLYEVHSVSDWVFIIDRYLGLEYFDSLSSSDRPMYLLDFSPEFSGVDSDRLLLTTRMVDEIVQLVRPVLEEYDLLLGDEQVDLFVLQLLRSLSGRLALKLLSSPNDVREAIGLAMARLFLEQYGLLKEAIVIPLDAHAYLFPESAAENVDSESNTLNRTDLLLVTCTPVSRLLHFHLIEVKWRTDLSGFSELMSVRQYVGKQIARSQDVLRQHFDPHLHSVDRIDRQVKTKELIGLLSFYLDRSRRYGLVSETAAMEMKDFIQELDRGYSLSFAAAGLLFDYGYEGIDSEEEYAGLAFHRVGRDYIRRLLENGLRRQALLTKQIEGIAVTIEESQRQGTKRERIIEETTMRRDPSYYRVRTLFPVSEPRGDSASGGQSDHPPIEGAISSIESSSTQGAGAKNSDLESPPTVEDPKSDSSEQAYDLGEVIGPKPEMTPSEKSDVEEPVMMCDILLGLESLDLKQYGVLGKSGGSFVGLDLNGTNTISLFGVQGGGKSYTVGTVVEMATKAIPGINHLPSPLATVIFHYHESQDYAPEFVSMVDANQEESELSILQQEYGAQSAALDDVVILTSPDKVDIRQSQYPRIRVEPIYFSSEELQIKDWRFLMGVTGTQMYMKQVTLIIRDLRRHGVFTLDALRQGIENSSLSDNQKSIVDIRLDIAAQFINDAYRLAEQLKPGRLIIVDLRDETIEKDEALGLFVVMLNIFANAGREDGYNKLIVFDEAHKYMDNRDLTSHIVDAIRQMRHQGVSLLIASQDPPSLPNEIIELSSMVFLHRFNSPQWLKHVQKSITALSDLTPAQMAALKAGDAYVWAAKATERAFTQKAVKMRLRPRATQHGGGTKTSV